jgi:histidyl-tRNA synthetase
VRAFSRPHVSKTGTESREKPDGGTGDANALRTERAGAVVLPAVPEYQAPRGMADVLPPQSARWSALVATFATHAERAGFGLAITPLIEHLEVFLRVGDSTDIVRKEMYDFEDKGGRHLAVRPEITAGLMRAFAEHRPPVPWKVWTVGPNFRYEAPQAGRYRQHFQLDAEIVGTDDPDADVEVIALLDGVHRALGLQRRALLINSLGDDASRPSYVAALTAYLDDHAADLSEQSRQTLAINPLRVLDSKRPEDSDVVAAAPQTLQYLSSAAEAHFDRMQEGLKSLGIEFEITPRLVRGLDYYNHTVFEFVAHALDAAQNAIGAGGRYNGLVEALGGPASTGGVGFGAGIERILLACDREGVFGAPTQRVQVFVVDTTGGREALNVSAGLRAAGISADRGFDGRSMKSQMKAADRSGAEVAVIIGPDELVAGEVTVRRLRAEGEQARVSRAALADTLRHWLSA